MKFKPNKPIQLFLAASFTLLSCVAFSASEECGDYPRQQDSFFGGLFESKAVAAIKKEAEAKRQACYARNRAQSDRFEKSASENCKQAIRRVVSTPTSIIWGERYSSDFVETDGGFRFGIRGTSADGNFESDCYTDKGFRVVNLSSESIRSRLQVR
jgi:hypothetical protein